MKTARLGLIDAETRCELQLSGDFVLVLLQYALALVRPCNPFSPVGLAVVSIVELSLATL